MNKRNALATFDMRQIVYDIVVIVLAYICADLMYKIVMGVSFAFEHIWMLIAFGVVFVLCMSIYRMYDVTTFYYIDRIFIRSFVSSLISAATISMVIFLLKDDGASRLLFTMFCVVAFGGILIQRYLRRKMRDASKTTGNQKVVFVGDKKVFDTFNHYISRTAMKVNFIDIIGLDDDLLTSAESLATHLVEIAADEVVFVHSINNPFDCEQHIAAVRDMGLTARVIVDFYDFAASHKYITSVGLYPVITYHSASLNTLNLSLKYTFDFLISLFSLVFLSPVLLIVSLAIKLGSKGPVVFKQERAGINGKIFEMYKFRTMCMDAEAQKQALLSQNKIKDGMMFKIEDDPRVTRVGAFLRKSSLDELPQLVNVLRGEMSLVGTRPPTLDEVAKYKRFHRRRLCVRPGITGMWQVSGRSDITDFDEVIALDNKYIDNWSLWLDFKLICKTFTHFLPNGNKGAY